MYAKGWKRAKREQSGTGIYHVMLRGINRQCAQGDSPRVHSMMSKKMTLYNDYTPDGRKLSSRHYGMVPKGNGSYRRLNTTDLYIDGLILRDGVPFMWQFDGGYVSLNANATPTSWNYYITDHLGWRHLATVQVHRQGAGQAERLELVRLRCPPV